MNNITKGEHDILINWLMQNIIPRQSINHNIDTSHIRLSFENDQNIYVDNDTMNDAMLELGYHAVNFAGYPYLHYNISSRSPVLQIYRTKVLGLE